MTPPPASPSAASPPDHHAGLRTVAVFEATKGAVVLVAGFGLLGFLNRDNAALAGQIVQHLHLNPAKGYPQIFIHAMAELTNARLWLLAGLAAAYAAIRFVEAYGLWRQKRWAEWLGALSGAIYIPFEVYKLAEQVTWLRTGTLLVNVAVVGYLGWVIFDSRRQHFQLTARGAAPLVDHPHP